MLICVNPDYRGELEECVKPLQKYMKGKQCASYDEIRRDCDGFEELTDGEIGQVIVWADLRSCDE